MCVTLRPECSRFFANCAINAAGAVYITSFRTQIYDHVRTFQTIPPPVHGYGRYCSSVCSKLYGRLKKALFHCTSGTFSFGHFSLKNFLNQHPIELVKTRMQVSGLGVGKTCSDLLAKEGFTAFWKGIPFGYGRELSYTSIKLGAYAPVRDMMGAGDPDSPLALKFLAGALTGGGGSIVGNPFDVLKTLAQTNQGNASLGSLVGGLYKDQGIKGFYRGVEVNIMRACILNATKMGVYDISKGYVSDTFGWKRKDPRTVFCSSFIAGFFMTITVAPA